MSLSRRDFVKLCTSSVAGYGISTMFHPEVHKALAQTLTGERPPVIWITGSACTGCSISILNAAHPAIADVLLKVISLEYHPTLMAGEGAGAFEYMMKIAEQFEGKFFLAIEGAVPIAEDGKYCVVGEAHYKEYTMTETVNLIAPKAAAVLAVGTCAAFGGVSAAQGSVTECLGVQKYLETQNINTPVVNISGCPPHPDWMVGSIVLALGEIEKNGLEQGLANVISILDRFGRPTPFYGKSTHSQCPYLGDYYKGKMCTSMTDKKGCRYDLGCKGPMASCNSALIRWNSTENWCIENGVCIGCVEVNFPDGKSPFYF